MLRQRGLMMLEVMITMLLVSGALLGAAGLQAYSVKLTQGSQFRSQAVVLANDLIERLEANNAGAVAGAYQTTFTTGSTPATATDCDANACDAATMAAFDLQEFETNLVTHLPASGATVTRSGAGPWTYTIQVTWQERSYSPKGTQSTLTGQTETYTYTVSRTVYDRSTVL